LTINFILINFNNFILSCGWISNIVQIGRAHV
jgi:hypothetical protein